MVGIIMVGIIMVGIMVVCIIIIIIIIARWFFLGAGTLIKGFWRFWVSGMQKFKFKAHAHVGTVSPATLTPLYGNRQNKKA